MEMKRFETLSEMSEFLKMYSISECIIIFDPSLPVDKRYIVFVDKIKTPYHIAKPITCPSCNKITDGDHAKFCQWCGNTV